MSSAHGGGAALDDQRGLEALHRLDEECVHYQRAGEYLKAFERMERALVLRRHFFGAESSEVSLACKALADMCNLLAMSFLQQDNYTVTIDLLKKAEVLTQHHHPAERATTLNNLACYYRRLGKLHAAMTSLTRALAIEKKLHNVRNAADTHLNLCAVLSQLGKHQEALSHAQSALLTLQDEFFQKQTNAEDSGGSSPTRSAMQLDRVSVMCIAYHNMGVEQEFLKDLENCVASYKKGVGLAEQYLGVDHAITTTVRNSYLAAKRTIAASPARKSVAMRGNGLSSLSNSPSKSPGRLLQSPRIDGSGGGGMNSLRMPSPLGKNRQQTSSGLPTPRSIIADTLSRSSPLPPLSAKSGAVLSPEDPFFSPRFRFEEGGVVKKASKKSEAKTKAEPEAAVLPPDTRSEEPEVAVILPPETPSVVPEAVVVVAPETSSDELETASAPIVAVRGLDTLQAESYVGVQSDTASDHTASASNAASAENRNPLGCDDKLQFGAVEEHDVAMVNRQSMYPSVWEQLEFDKQSVKANQEQVDQNPKQAEEAAGIQADHDVAASDQSVVEIELTGAFVSSKRSLPVDEQHDEPPSDTQTNEHSESDAIGGQRLDQQMPDDVQELVDVLDNSEQVANPFVSTISFESTVNVEAVVDPQPANDLVETQDGSQDEIAPADVFEEGVHSIPSEEPAEDNVQTEERGDMDDPEFAAGHVVDQQEPTPYEETEAIEAYADDQIPISVDEIPPGVNAPPEYPVAEENAPKEPDSSTAATELHEEDAAAYYGGNDVHEDYASEIAIEAVETPSEAELTSYDANEMSAGASEDDMIHADRTLEATDGQSAQETDESFGITQYDHEEVAATEQTHDDHGPELEIESAEAHEDEQSYNENDIYDGDPAPETLEEQINRLSSAAHGEEAFATEEQGVQDEHEARAEHEAEAQYEMHYEISAEDEGVDHHEYAHEDQAVSVDQSQLLQHEVGIPDGA